MLLLENWQRQAMVDRQAMLLRGVAENVPTFGTAQAKLDELLSSPPQPAVEQTLSVEQYELRQALGVLR